jgi:hypothetical protein
VTGCEWGLVNVFEYPVSEHGAGSRSYAGHSEYVIRTVFSADGKRLFTVGGEDKAVI